jgi:hypothetical protein
MELTGAATQYDAILQEEGTLLRFLALVGVIAVLVAGTALFASSEPAGGSMASATPASVTLVHNTSVSEK